MAFGSFSLCCYTCGKRISVSLRSVYDIFQRVSGQIPLQIVHADMPDRVLHVRAAAEARACNMRREQHVLHVPQRTVRRKRFGLEHIECGAAEVAIRREQLDRELKRVLEEKVAPWGVTVLSVEVRDILLPKELQDVMSLEAQADREKNARMTVVGVEAELAEMLAEAARVYGDPEAAQKRFDQYRRCTAACCEQFRKGTAITQLIAA